MRSSSKLISVLLVTRETRYRRLTIHDPYRGVQSQPQVRIKLTYTGWITESRDLRFRDTVPVFPRLRKSAANFLLKKRSRGALIIVKKKKNEVTV